MQCLHFYMSLVQASITSWIISLLYCSPQQTLLNAKHQYVASLVCAYLTMIVMGAMAFKTAGGSMFNIYKLTSRQTHRDY